MPVPVNYTNPTGKQNVLTSLNKWLETNVPAASSSDFVYIFDNEIQANTLPSVQVSEFQYFDPGADFFGMNVFPKSAYPVSSPANQGSRSEMMILIDIKADQGSDVNAKKVIYQIRDRIRRGLMLAGVSDDVTDVQILPPISVLDYDNAAADTGIIAQIPTEQDNCIQEKYLPPDASAENLHSIQLLVRLWWFELN